VAWLKGLFEELFHHDTIIITAAHPLADDPSVQYSVVPHTPWGEITLRWWADATYGYCFDLVDIARRKILNFKDLQLVRSAGFYGTYMPMESIEEGHRRCNLGGNNAEIKYTVNADGIVEERYAVMKGSCVGLRRRGGGRLIAMVAGPGVPYNEDSVVPEGAPVYMTFPPV